MNALTQSMILVCSTVGFAMVALGEDRGVLLAGNIIGLAGQPFWLYSSHKTRQWGIFAQSCIFTLVWLAGIWRHW